MKISKRIRYGLRALLYLSKKKNFASVEEISKKEQIPSKYLEKILLELKRKKILASKRGTGGGFKLNLKEISLKDLIEILDYPFLSPICKKTCPIKNCQAKYIWLKVQNKLAKELNKLKVKNANTK